MKPTSEQDWLGLDGASAAVLGATGGLGQAIVRGMSQAGMRIFVHGRSNRSRLEDLAALPGVSGAELADLSLPDHVVALAKKIGSWCSGQLDALVYVVGVNPTAAPIRELPTAVWDLTMDVNLRGAFLATQALMPSLLAARSPRVVLISSIYALQAPANRAAYGASKHGMTGLIQSFVREEGMRIHMNALAPGPAWGENVRHIFAEQAEREGITAEEYTRRRTERIPMRRFLDPIELANAVLFLCSYRSTYINGQVIAVTGGAHE